MIELKLQDDSLSVGEEFAMMRELHRKRKSIIGAAVDRFLERRERAALCTHCPSPREPGKTLCAVHLKKGRERSRAHYEKHRVLPCRYRCGHCGELGHTRTGCPIR